MKLRTPDRWQALMMALALGAPFVAQTDGAVGAEPQPQSGFIGGTTPAQRPPGTPRIDRVDHDAQWLKTALSGISQPIPPDLTPLMKDQGNWFTPFDRPGMTGKYDIRGWHRVKSP